jgi:DNA modification methylase
MPVRNRVVEMKWIKAYDLVPNPHNYRLHPQAQVNALRTMLGEIGNADGLIVRQLPDGRYMLIDGHLRAEIMPNEEVPVIVVDLDESEADLLLATFDPMVGMAVADSQRLNELLESVRSDNPNVMALLDTIRAQEGLLLESLNELADPEPQIDKADALRKKWGTDPGQLWEMGPHRLICGDSRDSEIVSKLWQEDASRLRMVWSDPAYGVDYGSKNEFLNKTDRANRVQKPIKGDALGPAEASGVLCDSLKQALKFAHKGAACYTCVPSGTLLPHFIAAYNDSGFCYKHLLVWVKQQLVIGMCDYQPRHEVILYGWLENGRHYFVPDRTHTSVFEVDKPHVSDLHPTTKPTLLVGRMIANSSRRGEVVYDPFCGSGTTLVASAQLKRIGYGCELDPAYAAVTLERLASLGFKPQLRR